ncbi:MAG TPA: 3-oxoacyl-[acyl-carrier-protein] synthase III C-terminal domain-containing protein [Polyangiaceae bacterium]|nr:3-oxoacyl-[acyl-carrier-protein] synthase III C-terminal domain-containing protein [Polyangiaceae bacterium]
MMRPESSRAGFGHSAELVAFASAYPQRVVTNDEYLQHVEFTPTDGWAQISRESGFTERRWCNEQENCATLMLAAIEQLRDAYPEQVNQVDAVVVASGTTVPVVLPISTANVAAADLAPLALRHLHAKHALGLDLKACYCTGFLRGLEVADGLLASPHRRAVLVIAVEQGSKLAVARSNRSSFCFMVGDAAGAVIVRKASSNSGRGLIDHYGYTAPEYLDLVGIGEDARSLIMRGSKAAEASHQLFVECGQALLSRNKLKPSDISWLLPLQTHRNLVARVAAALQWPEDRIIWDASALGFSGSASIPACLADQVKRGAVRTGDSVLALAVGAGLNCAGALFRL